MSDTLHRPDREPDMVLPKVGNYYKIDMWVDESMFGIYNGRLDDEIECRDDIKMPGGLMVNAETFLQLLMGDNTLAPREHIEIITSYIVERELL